MGHVPKSNLRDTLTANGWRIDFLGPTAYLGNTTGFGPVTTPSRKRWSSSCRPKRSNRCER